MSLFSIFSLTFIILSRFIRFAPIDAEKNYSFVKLSVVFIDYHSFGLDHYLICTTHDHRTIAEILKKQ